MLEPGYEVVYVLTNPAMPGLVKIGRTNQRNIADRMRQLYTTGVPFPFECEYACQVKDCEKVENAFHLAFGNVRVNSKREFFKIEPERVISVLQLLAVLDLTPQVEGYLSENVSLEEKISAQKIKSSRRPPMNFFEMNIQVGETLVYKDGETTAVIAAEKKVEYNGEICSLTAVTRELMNLNYSVQPSPYWSYLGRPLVELYNETYVDEEA